jgi:hypothetical protein
MAASTLTQPDAWEEADNQLKLLKLEEGGNMRIQRRAVRSTAVSLAVLTMLALTAAGATATSVHRAGSSPDTPPCSFPLNIHVTPDSGPPGTPVHLYGCTGGALPVHVFFRDLTTGKRSVLGQGSGPGILRVWTLDAIIPTDATPGPARLIAKTSSDRATCPFTVTEPLG